jgi:hypothetical protein
MRLARNVGPARDIPGEWPSVPLTEMVNFQMTETGRDPYPRPTFKLTSAMLKQFAEVRPWPYRYHNTAYAVWLVQSSHLSIDTVENRPRVGCYSKLLTEAYWSLFMHTVISVSIWFPVSSVLSACYCLDRHCVLKSLVTPEYDRITRQLLPTILCIPVCCAYQIHPSALFAISTHASPSVLYRTKSSTPTASRATSRTCSHK